MKKLTKKKVKEIVNRYCTPDGNFWIFDKDKFFKDLVSKEKKGELIKVIRYALENYNGILSLAKTPFFIDGKTFTGEPNEMLFLAVLRMNTLKVSSGKYSSIKTILKSSNWKKFIRDISITELNAKKQDKGE